MSPDGKTIRPLDERRTVAEAAADRVREAILSGVYVQGQRISDSRLAEELGVSRGSTREALKILQAQGFLVQRANRGTYVWSPSGADIRESCEIRVALETHASRQLAARHSEDDLAVLSDLVSQLDRAAASDDQVAASRLDKEFHESLIRLCGNARLSEVYEREISTMLGFFGVDADAYRPLTEMGRELGPLCDAIAEADADRAAGLIETHVRRSTSIMAAHVESSSRR